jgi:hypothetical protein
MDPRSRPSTRNAPGTAGPRSRRHRLSLAITAALLALTTGSAQAANHFIVLFDASGSVKKEHLEARDFWGGKFGDNTAMASIVKRFVDKVFAEMPEGFPSYHPDQDRFSFLLFNVDPHHPHYAPERMFYTNDKLIAATGGLPAAEDYERFEARVGAGPTLDLKEVFRGHSPLIAATGTSLPFLAQAMAHYHKPYADRAAVIDHTYIIRITDGMFNSESNGADEHDVILKTAKKFRDDDRVAALTGDDGFIRHQELIRQVGRVFEIGTNRINCAFPTNNRADTFGRPFDCAPYAFKQVAGWGLGFLISYMEVEPKAPALAGLARTEKNRLELDTICRLSDVSIHLTATNAIVAASADDLGGLFRLVPTSVQWRPDSAEWQKCTPPDPVTGEVDCGPGGPRLDFPEGQVPEVLHYRVTYQMHFPAPAGSTTLYPYRRSLETLDLHPVTVTPAAILDRMHLLPRDPDQPTLGGLNPDWIWNGDKTQFPERPIDAATLKAQVAAWRDQLGTRMGEWKDDWHLPDTDTVLPRMIAKLSDEKKDQIQEQEAGYHSTAAISYSALFLGLMMAWAVWPRRTLKASIEGQVSDEFMLDFNDPPHRHNLLVGMVRVQNERRTPLKLTYGFKALEARLERHAPLADNAGGDPNALRFADRGPVGSAPLAIGAPRQNSLTERHAASGKEFPIFFDPAEVIDLDQDVGAVEARFRIPVHIAVSANKALSQTLPLNLPLAIRPERGRLGITCFDAVPLEAQDDDKLHPVRIAEWRGDERGFLLCTYALRNTAAHRYSLPVQGEIGIQVLDQAGKPIDNSIVRLIEGDRESDSFDYHLRRDDPPFTVKLVVDFTRLRNPVSTEDYRILIRLRDGSGIAATSPGPADLDDLNDIDAWKTIDTPPGEWLLRVARSTERTDCSLVVMENEQRRSDPLNKAHPELPAPFPVGTPEHPRPAHYQAQDPLNRLRLCRLRLANACRNGHGYAQWQAEVRVLSADRVKVAPGALRLIDGRGQPLDHGTLYDSPDEARRQQDLAVELFLNEVAFHERDARISVDIRVDWTSQPDGGIDPLRIERFTSRASLACCLRHEPPREVLAVDFGTSALAVAHALGPNGVQLLPLPNRLADLEKETGRRRRLEDPIQSHNKLFLASEFNVCVDDDRLAQTEPDAPAFLDLPLVTTAPYEHPDKCFTSLKALISAGFQALPLDVKRHPYQYQGRREARTPPPLGPVITGAYRGLLRNFIEPILTAGGRRGYSHVYITHPNTYTPNHVRQLRAIVEDVFAGIAVDRNVVYPDNIHFVSESDAVAYYFLIYARRLRGPDAVVPTRERILVYDIGAGTLDLTYLEVDWEPNEAEGFTPKRIRVRRRGGVAKAGDLLDECIARDLHAYLDGALDATRYLTPIVVAAEGERMDEATVRRMDALRQQIHVLKAQVSASTEAPSLELSTVAMGAMSTAPLVLTDGMDTPGLYEGCNQLRPTQRGEVYWEPGRETLLNGRYVSAFIEQVTRTEVHRFFGGEVPRLDTVILSGRTSLWPGFGDRLRATLGEVAHWVDFSGDADTLKQVVVMGVIQREYRWRNVAFEAPEVIGRFGVRYERAHAGDWYFEGYERSGDAKEFYLQDASEVHIGLLTNNGFHRCYSLLPDLYYDADNPKLTIRLDFDASGYLRAEVTNTRGDTESFADLTSPPTLTYDRVPWPLGAAKLHHRRPESLMGGDHPEDWT